MIRTQAFYDYVNERDRIRLKKEAGLPPPWTEDPILGSYKFTNVHRHHDRTSRELIQRFYKPHSNDDQRAMFMNAALFRYFGTWEFAEAVGWQDYDNFKFQGIKQTAKERFKKKERVFTGAYVITNQGISAPKENVVVDYFLRDLHAATPSILEIANNTQSWKDVCEAMSSIKGFGGTGFMAKEILIDTTYYDSFWAEKYPKDWSTWTPIGPGGKRGVARVMDLPPDWNVSKNVCRSIIKDLMIAQEEHWQGERLYPTDIQFNLCEFDKYERVRLNEGKPRSKYKPR